MYCNDAHTRSNVKRSQLNMSCYVSREDTHVTAIFSQPRFALVRENARRGNARVTILCIPTRTQKTPKVPHCTAVCASISMLDSTPALNAPRLVIHRHDTELHRCIAFACINQLNSCTQILMDSLHASEVEFHSARLLN